MSTHSMKSMVGHDVIAVDTAEDIGDVKHFVVSPDAAKIERLHIDGRRSNALFAEWGDLESFGTDRVMVAKADAPDTSDDDRDIDAAKGSIEILGTRILTTAGFEVGVVDDVEFDGDTGAVVSVLSSEGRTTPSAAIHSLGSYALVIDA